MSADVVALIRSGSRFLVTCHRAPDADALGSALGLSAVLRALGKEVTTFAPDALPMSLRFLAEAQPVERCVPVGARYDATFVMDIAARSLMPEGLPDRAHTGPIVVVDHHATHDDIGDVVLRDADASATGELVLRLVLELGLPSVPEAAAMPLYASLVADTGGFRYPNTRAETLRMAADLVDAGVDPWNVAYNLFEGWERAKLSLLGEVLGTLELHEEGRLATLRVTRAMLERIGASDDMVEGIVNYGRIVRGVEIAALVWEKRIGPRPQTKVSFRSRGTIDVAAIALTLGGGGHPAAAAALVDAPIDELFARVLEGSRRALLAGAPRALR